MKVKLIAIIIILFCIAAPAYADEPPPSRPLTRETAAATKAAYVEQVRPTATPEPYPLPTVAPYPEPEVVAWWEWLFKWIAE